MHPSTTWNTGPVAPAPASTTCCTHRPCLPTPSSACTASPIPAHSAFPGSLWLPGGWMSSCFRMPISAICPYHHILWDSVCVCEWTVTSVRAMTWIYSLSHPRTWAQHPAPVRQQIHWQRTAEVGGDKEGLQGNQGKLLGEMLSKVWKTWS